MKRPLLITATVVLAMLLITRLCILDIVKVPEGHCPRAGGWAFVSRWAYGYRLPWNPSIRWRYSQASHGDWVAYNQPTSQRSDTPDTTAVRIGRIQAVPGDTLWYNNQSGQVALHRRSQQGYTHPLVIPSRGRTITITRDNLQFYAITIMNHEPVKASVLGDSLCVNGGVVRRYTFHSDYYWVTTERPSDPTDSRTFGFVPQATLIGKVL